MRVRLRMRAYVRSVAGIFPRVLFATRTVVRAEFQMRLRRTLRDEFSLV